VGDLIVRRSHRITAGLWGAATYYLWQRQSLGCTVG